MWNIEELKKEIMDYAIETLTTRLNYTQDEAISCVKKSKIEESIEKVPDIIAHYSEEQLLYALLY